MRKDMSKVIVERPRYGGKRHRAGRPSDIDLLSGYEGMRKPYLKGYHEKQLNENLAPLRRFLMSRIGRPWDDVYQEICQHINVTSAVQKHVRDHINDIVCLNTKLDNNGQIWVHTHVPELLSETRSFLLYVDPISKVLSKNPYYRPYGSIRRQYNAERLEKQHEVQRSLPNGVELRKANGIWYQVELLEIPEKKKIVKIDENGKEYSWHSGGSAYDVILGVELVYNVRCMKVPKAIDSYTDEELLAEVSRRSKIRLGDYRRSRNLRTIDSIDDIDNIIEFDKIRTIKYDDEKLQNILVAL